MGYLVVTQVALRSMYNKLFTKILDSSIWLESTSTRLVWLTMIAAMDENGFTQFASVANLSHRARVSPEEAQAAVDCLEAPDPNSSDPDNEGRRIEKVPGGWMVLNAGKYRDLVKRSLIQEQTRQRVAAFRSKKACNAGVTLGNANLESVTHMKRSVTPSEADTATTTDPEATAVPPNNPSPSLAAPKDTKKSTPKSPKTPEMLRLGAIFNQRESTRWSERALKLHKQLTPIPEDEMLSVEKYQRLNKKLPPEQDFSIRDLETLLSKWGQIVDRGRNLKEPKCF